MTDGAPGRDPAELNLYCLNCHVRNWPFMPRVIVLDNGIATCTACKRTWPWPPRKGFRTP